MYRNAIQYRGTWLAPGSTAHQLHTDKKFKELDQHLKALDEKEKRLMEGK